MEKVGRPRLMSISTSTGTASMPAIANVRVRASTAATLGGTAIRVVLRMRRFRA